MGFLGKIKAINPKLGSRKVKIVSFSLLVLGSVAAATMTTLAWFNLSTKESKIKMVSGDLDVEIRKVSAYKYVYPYYKDSTEFIDYDNTNDAVVKKYVLKDYNYDNLTISSDNATVTLNTKVRGSFTNDTSSASSSLVYVPSVPNNGVYKPGFRYYLIGDDLFCGQEGSWQLEKGFAFSSRDDVTENSGVSLDNIVVSVGSSFRFLETRSITENDQNVFAYNYFPLASIAENNPAFSVIDDNDDGVGDRLLCLRSGIYKFTYTENQLSIELRTKENGSRKDISVITNNSLDPTKISIDYAGSVSHTTYPTIESYVPQAIYNQNTAIVIDVELNFTNPNPVDARLKIERTNATANSIYNLSNKYADTTHNLKGYVNESEQNLLRASDFYNFYAKFTATPYANAGALWTGMHHVGDNQCQKFLNDTSYDNTVECTLVPKENNDSIVVPASNSSDNIYHCYISIEYDYEHCVYFLNENRLGKTYLLDRDFTFHFMGIQHKES